MNWQDLLEVTLSHGKGSGAVANRPGWSKRNCAWPNPPAPRIGKALSIRVPEKGSSEVTAGQEDGPGLITGKASVAQERVSTCE